MSIGQKQEKFGKAKYKVGFLGYFDVSWLYGREPTDSALRDLLYGQQRRHRGGGGDGDGGGTDPLPRLSITVDKKELRITQTIAPNGGGGGGGKRGGKNKIRFPGISGNDVLSVSQGSAADIEGIVGCIYYDRGNAGPGSSSWPITVHGYLFESTKLATRFARHVRQLTDTVEHRDVLVRRERELVDGGVLIPDPRLPAGQFLMRNRRDRSPDCAAAAADYDDQITRQQGAAGNLETGSSQCRPTTDDSGRVSPSSAAAAVAAVADTVSSDSSNGVEVKKRPARLPRTTLIFPEDGNHSSSHDGGGSYDGSYLSRNQCTEDPSPEPNCRPIPGAWTAECIDGAAVEVSSRFDVVDGRRCSGVGGESSVSRDSSFSSSSSAGHNRLPRTRPTSCLAAEFKSKLAQGPILLPPKDYDTFSRTRGTMAAIEERKCLNPQIVGKTSSSSNL